MRCIVVSWVIALISTRALSQGPCGRTFTAMSRLRTISSTNYPENYPSKHNCWWHITAPAGNIVALVFTEFATEGCCDKLKIFDSPIRTGNNQLLIRVLGGDIASPFRVYSRNNYLSLRFESDSSLSYRGFSFTYRAIRPLPTPSAVTRTTRTTTTSSTTLAGVCGFTRQVTTNEPVEFTSPNHPRRYPPNSNCQWTLSTTPGRVVQLTIGRVETELKWDFIEVWDGIRKLARLEGLPATQTFVSVDYTGLIVTFQSDRSVNRNGFHAVFRSVPAGIVPPELTLPELCGFNTTATNAFQIITSPLYPNLYPLGIECKWYITSPPGSTILFNVTSTNIESCCDFLEIYDGTRAIGSLAGRLRGWRAYRSTGNFMMLLFYSDDSVARTGFHAKFKSFTPTITTTTTTAIPTTTVPSLTVPTPATKASTVAKTSTIAIHTTSLRPGTTCGYETIASSEPQILTSPQFPSTYQNNLYCEWVIGSPTGYTVQLTVGYLDTELCCDYLVILVGRSEVARLRGVLSEPVTYLSVVGITVRFVTDSSINEKGFQLVYRSVHSSSPITPLSLPCKYLIKILL
nr:deleted in malignant brain tumors 1 protein-like isoform X1 [Ciona intestinalis]|eukprot:XP_026693975.1 deleted in malignant brain tumors 1 protein-like isoform X1 [Ciona intestinalis]